MDHKMDVGQFLIRRYDRFHAEKSTFLSLWDEVLEVFRPMDSFVFAGANQVQGQKKTAVLTSSGIEASETFANGLHTFLTNPTVQFFEYMTGNPELDRDIEVRKYLDARTQLCHQLINDTNFHSVVHECYIDLGIMGTDVLRMEEVDTEEIMRFESRPIHECVIAENEHGVVDEIGREKEMTGEQILARFGDKWIYQSFNENPAMGEDLKHKLLSDPTYKFRVIEYFMPNKKLKEHGYKVGRRPFSMYSILKPFNIVMKTQNFNENIYAVSRLMKTSNEKYGRSYGMKCLPDILSLNELVKVMIQAGQLNVKPPIIVPDDASFGGYKIFPGSYMYKRPGAESPTPFNPNSRHDIAVEMIERFERNIKKGFQNDKLEFPDFQRATAEEVRAVKEQDLRLLSPMLSRQHNEKLTPLIKRVDAVAERRGVFDSLTLPKKLEENSVSIQYSSAIARVQKTQLADNATRWFAAVEAMAGSKPEVLDWVNEDNYARYLAQSLSTAGALVRTQEEVDEIRAQRQQAQEQALEQQQQMQEAEVAEKGASAFQKVGGQIE